MTAVAKATRGRASASAGVSRATRGKIEIVPPPVIPLAPTVISTDIVSLRVAIERAVKGVVPRWDPHVRFRLLEGDEDPGAVAVNSGALRRFMVFAGEGEEGAYQAFTDAELHRRFMLTFVYPTQRALNTKLRDQIESDIHDLRVALNQYLIWAAYLADPTALLHAIVPQWEQPQIAAQAGRLLLVLPLDVQYLESVI